MSLRFALLALLSAEPMTGYDIMQFFDDSVAYVWHAPHTQLYPELRRLEEQGLVAAESIPRGPRGHKRLYHLTHAGLEQFRKEANTVVEPSRERDPYRLRAAYLEWADPDAAREQLRVHIDHFQKWLEVWRDLVRKLRARDVALLRERLARTPREQHEAIIAFKVYAYEGLIARARMEIAWAKRGLELIDRLEATGWSGPVSLDGEKALSRIAGRD